MTQQQAIYFIEQAVKNKSKLELVKIVKDFGGYYTVTPEEQYLGLKGAKDFVDKYDIFSSSFNSKQFLKDLITEYPHIKQCIRTIKFYLSKRILGHVPSYKWVIKETEE